jgi:hypothetical protein
MLQEINFLSISFPGETALMDFLTSVQYMINNHQNGYSGFQLADDISVLQRSS